MIVVKHIRCTTQAAMSALLGCGFSNSPLRVSDKQVRVLSSQPHSTLLTPSAASVKLSRVDESDVDDIKQFPKGRIFHYTTKKAGGMIKESGELKPSTKPKNARHGVGQYFTNVDPDVVICSRLAAKLLGYERQYSASELARRFFNNGNICKIRNVVSLDLRSLVKMGRLYRIEHVAISADAMSKALPMHLYVNLSDSALQLERLDPVVTSVLNYPDPEPCSDDGSVCIKRFKHSEELVRYAVDKSAILVNVYEEVERNVIAIKGLSSVLMRNALYPKQFEQGVGDAYVKHAKRSVATLVLRGAVSDRNLKAIERIKSLFEKGGLKRVVIFCPNGAYLSEQEMGRWVNDIKSVMKERCTLTVEFATIDKI